jgi:peptidoglycan/LPS O-acetylase OafA/YrhL
MWQIHPPYFLVAWSLSIEEWFYFTAAVVLSIAARRMHPKCALLVTLVLLIAVPFVVRSWLSWTTDWSWNDAIRQYVPLRLDAIASGVALVWAWRSWPLVRRYAGLWVGLAIGLVMLYITAVQYWQPVWEHTPWVRITLIPVMSLGIMALFPFLAGIQRPQPSIVERGLQWISILSYPLYLLHYPVRQTVQGLIGAAGSSVWADIVVTVVFYAGSFWVALQWHRELEQPIMRLRFRQ